MKQKNKNRIKVVLPTDVTQQEAAAALALVRQAQINRNRIDADKAAATKKLDEEFAARLEECDQIISRQTDLVRIYAENHPEVFGENKSVTWLHGRFGFRTGMPKLVKKVKTKWDDLVAIVKEKLGGKYIRLKEEINEAQIIADRETLDKAALRAAGLAVEQDEGFFIEPNIVYTPVTTEAAKAA